MASKKLLTRRNVAIIAILVVVLLVAGYFAGVLDITRVTGANTTTQSLSYSGWVGDGTQGPVGADGKQHELLDAPKYIGGFYADGHSEKIVADAVVTRTTSSCIVPDAGLYRFWFRSVGATYMGATFTPTSTDPVGRPIPTDSPGPGFVLIKEDYIPSGSLASGVCPALANAPNSITEVEGNFIGILHVDFLVSFFDAGRLQNSNDANWAFMVKDEATVQAGWGVISIQNTDQLVQVGESVSLHYDTGAACADRTDPARVTAPCGWTLSLRNFDTGATPEGWTDKTIGDYQSATLSVPVKASWFTIGAKNIYQVKLFNQVNLQDEHKFVTIDDRTLAPGTPSVTVSPGPPYHAGNQLTIAALSAPNSITKNPIVSYHITVRQGDHIQEFDSTTGTVTYTIPEEQVDVHIEATAFDGQRTSGVNTKTVTVADSDLDNNPPPPPPGGINIPIWVYFVIAAAAIILLVYFNPGEFLSAYSPLLRLVLILIAIILIFVGLVLGGVLHF